MAEAAQYLANSRSDVQAERGTDAVKSAKAALDAFKEAKDTAGVIESSLLLIRAFTLNGQYKEASSTDSDVRGKTKDKKELRHLDVLKAETLLAQGKDAEALKLCDSVHKSSGEEDKQNAGRALLASVKVHISMGNNKPAVEAAEKAVACFNNAGEDHGEADAWAAVMNARFAAGDSEGAGSASYAAMALYGEAGDKLGEAIVLLRLSQAEMKLKNPGEAMAAANPAFRTFRQCGGGKLELEALDVLVRAYSNKGQGGDALALAKLSVASARRGGNRHNEGVALLSLARAHASTDPDSDAGEMIAKEALSIFQDLGDKAMEANSMATMAHVNLSSLYFEGAHQASDDASALYKELADDKSQAAMKKLHEDVNAFEDREGRRQWNMWEKYEQQRELDMLEMKECLKQCENRDKELFRQSYNKIRRSKTLTEEDFRKAGLREMDDIVWFLCNMGYRCDNEPSTHYMTLPPEQYMMHRQMGMHYGPGFRLNRMIGVQGENSMDATTWGNLALHAWDYEPNTNWEDISWYHAGMLDCGLQGQAARFKIQQMGIKMPGHGVDSGYHEI